MCIICINSNAGKPRQRAKRAWKKKGARGAKGMVFHIPTETKSHGAPYLDWCAEYNVQWGDLLFVQKFRGDLYYSHTKF